MNENKREIRKRGDSPCLQQEGGRMAMSVLVSKELQGNQADSGFHFLVLTLCLEPLSFSLLLVIKHGPYKYA
jgi:hypothetical protein